MLQDLYLQEIKPLAVFAAEMSWAEIVFATIGGLRGAVSLILAQVVVTEQNPDPSMQDRKVTAEV